MAPVVTGVTPNQGSSAGGTMISVTGTGFANASAVRLGGATALGLTVLSDTHITAVTPPGAGTVNVTVTGSGGTSTQNVPFTYTTAPAPVVLSLIPDQGPTAGGTTATLTGTGFTGATLVSFGPISAAFTVVSATQITVTIPPRATTGPVLVTVTTPGGVSYPVGYAYQPAAPATPPVLVEVTPDQGPLAGGTTVTLTGTGFTGATAVRFDATPAPAFTVMSNTVITATTPPGSGTVTVTVTTPAGTSGPGPLTSFTYLAAPTVTTLTPSQGPTFGGNPVTVAGSDFTYATDVRFGGIPAPFTIVSDTFLVATAPPGTGTVTVTVASAGGTSGAGPLYTYE
ncbi:IPT/TIG domain-containing protein [Microbispora sp. RL4-1S]|uniref:IPT/TIG domain-containing protein n=1 Tax=Microbispora oryzae TaxID=2806554 RepID=A0A940WSE7_9ACTN|nr:IPT/TIG domain-containing protein [Microbispora oryzae]MBP2708543.1 IPT/TIG domain-containing protein [Microbispora oryzae]